MSQFNNDKIDMFLGVVRKYMQVRGPMSQKDLAEMTDIGVSTMSRFLNQQTKELNPQLIANITAKLLIPLHEMIDFVEEDYTEQFMRLVKFYKGEESTDSGASGTQSSAQKTDESDDESFMEALGAPAGSAQRTTNATINVGNKKTNITFQADGNSEGKLKDKMKSLTARQKGFLHDFLNLDMEGRDLVVDIGKNIISYLRQKGIDF